MSCKNDRDDDPCVSSPLALCILCAYGCGGVETIDSMLAGRAVVEIWHPVCPLSGAPLWRRTSALSA